MRLLTAIPLMIIPLGFYLVFAMGSSGTAVFETVWFQMTLISGGTVTITQGTALMALTLFVLFLEVVKATRTGFGPVMDHVLSVITVIVFVVTFIVWAPAATGLFALMTLASLVDVLAGLWISLNVARRDVAISPGGSF